MKQCIKILFLILIIVSAQSEDIKYMKETVRTNGEIYQEYNVKFYNSSGIITKEYGIHHRMEYMYNNLGQLLKTVKYLYNTDGTYFRTSKLCLYTYHTNGKIKSCTCNDIDSVKTINTYNEKGKLIKEELYNGKKKTVKNYISENKLLNSYSEDDYGYAIERCKYDSIGRKKSYYHFELEYPDWPLVSDSIIYDYTAFTGNFKLFKMNPCNKSWYYTGNGIINLDSNYNINSETTVRQEIYIFYDPTTGDCYYDTTGFQNDTILYDKDANVIYRSSYNPPGYYWFDKYEYINFRDSSYLKSHRNNISDFQDYTEYYSYDKDFNIISIITIDNLTNDTLNDRYYIHQKTSDVMILPRKEL